MSDRATSHLSETLAKYDYACGFSRANWAWEFARRNPDLRKAAFAGQRNLNPRTACRGIRLLSMDTPDASAEGWGLLFFPQPDRSALTTDVFWSDAAFPGKITLNVRGREPGEVDEIFEQSTQCCRVSHLLDSSGKEHIIVRGERCAIQVRCAGKSLLSQEPVKMEFAIPGFSTLAEHHAALNRARRVYGEPGDAPPVWSRKGLGYRNALVALDAHEAGLTYQETATIFYGQARAASAWAGPSLAMKSEMARLLAKGRFLRDGGYRQLIGGAR